MNTKQLPTLPFKPLELHPKDGAAVAEWLACSPPAKVNQAQSPARLLPDFRMWKSCQTILLVGGFSRGSHIYPPLFIPGMASCTEIDHSQCTEMSRSRTRGTHRAFTTGEAEEHIRSISLRHLSQHVEKLRRMPRLPTYTHCTTEHITINTLQSSSMRNSGLNTNSSRTHQHISVTSKPNGMPFANQRFVTHTPAGCPTNWKLLDVNTSLNLRPQWEEIQKIKR
ncbi:hypothetical protein PR048_033630 [Dryococelus australis]|uniref:Uncharacterized protein n=1 Tax=Dryococelus australis TaxID=614101 RepID=A0ABQ9G0U4_9NEOP|nr:hypothetical protein PR048_033630 [Dryococelus australis]